ncbi:MAG TPA: DUF4907 domain-containing protein [Bacteroidia bacterium]|nr:DUF4907 domain-containing protein [Bacteroidia bacterium]
MKLNLWRLICGLVLSTVFEIQAQQVTQNKSSKEIQFPETYANSNLSYKLIDAPNKTFCYDIYVDGRLMIHQPSVPGLPGNEGFKTRLDAENVAKLVISKIKRGEVPPSVSVDEMKKLKAIP